MAKLNNTWIVLLAVFFTGCATAPDKAREADSFLQFLRGDVVGALATHEEAHKQVENRDTTYSLNKGIMLRLGGKSNLSNSTESLIKADVVVDNWMVDAKTNLNKNTNEFATYLLASKSKNIYEPKDYEKSFLSYNIALNYLLEGKRDLALVNAKRIAERETIISRYNERKLISLRERETIERKRGSQAFSSIRDINGYPVNLLDSPDVSLLKNSYQNAAAHYLAAFIFEQQGEPGLAAPGYRLALELKPNNFLFSKSLAELDKKSAATSAESSTTDLLIVVESGNVPRISTHSSNINFNTKKGPRIVTIRLPIIGQSINSFRPNFVGVGGQSVPLAEAVNVDAMARRQLKDDMPGHIFKATTQAIIQIVAQEAAQAAAEKNKSQGSAGGMFAALAVGAALSVGEADTRMWSNLPGSVHLGRTMAPKGLTQISINTPSGPLTFQVNLADNYQVVYIRTLGGRAIITAQNGTQAYSSQPLLAMLGH
jgi:hypothetical protein